MRSSSRIAVAAVAALVCCVPAASAATLHGTVVGEPKASKGRVVVPVLLSAAGARSAGGPLAKVSVPVRKGIRTTARSLKSSELRIGDRVAAVVSRVRRTDRASVLRVRARGTAPSFAKLAQSRATAVVSVKNAISSVDQIKANPMTLLDPSKPAKSNEELRAQFLELRGGLNRLIADLRASAAGIESAITTIERGRPSDASRNAAVAAQQRGLLDSLASTGDGERTAATQLEAAVTQLEQYMNDIGGASAPSAGLNEVGTVSDVLHSVLELLRDPG